ncbi:hypothetical protein CERSUDRAFT_83240 [Gelatoporia subvermispora B]|uniref:Protein kinase domain-containing protein n=1 Tax=Ceriporiopsis subvermispora (strain B) TaxID=914234 RepID=M2QZA2_CERS8|nr:hypothetical protein CERSUDRAFT_83240 [Gelatoporia subvermispora B]
MGRHSLPAFGDTFMVSSEYELSKELGQGAHGCVIAAKHRGSGETCAIKKLTNVNVKLIQAKRCLREIKLMRHFRNHQNIACLYDADIVFAPDGSFDSVYLYLELMEADLHGIIRSGQSLTDQHFQSFIYQTLCGLKYIHSAGVLHRDLKPANLLVNEDCELKICDFGLARGYNTCAVENIKRNNGRGPGGFMSDYVAMRWYRAPELMLSFENYGPATDMWALGCILGELIDGKPIFRGRDYVHQLNMIIDKLGSPSEESLERVGSPYAQDYIRSLPNRPRVSFSMLFPNANPLALDLLDKLLQFDPRGRITCSDALDHPYFADWIDPKDQPVCDQPFGFEFENVDTKEELLHLIAMEVTNFRQGTSRQSPERRHNVGARNAGNDALPAPQHEEMLTIAHDTDDKLQAVPRRVNEYFIHFTTVRIAKSVLQRFRVVPSGCEGLSREAEASRAALRVVPRIVQSDSQAFRCVRRRTGRRSIRYRQRLDCRYGPNPGLVRAARPLDRKHQRL